MSKFKFSEHTNVIVLLSGGIDSSACINYYLQQGYQPKAFFVDYGQVVCKKENESAKKIAAHYGVELETINIDMAERFGKGELSGRNALFIFAALMKFH